MNRRAWQQLVRQVDMHVDVLLLRSEYAAATAKPTLEPVATPVGACKSDQRCVYAEVEHASIACHFTGRSGSRRSLRGTHARVCPTERGSRVGSAGRLHPRAPGPRDPPDRPA